MITLSASGGSVTFEFSGNSTYLNDGQITVPVNSLALIIDESDMATFRKSASNDIFVSANIAEFGMTKAELESWYKANMVGSTGGGGGGITSGEVQTMIDEAVSGKANSSDVYTTGQTSGATEIANALNAKLDATAYTPTDLSEYWTSAQTSSAIDEATSGKTNQSDFTAYTASTDAALSGKVDTEDLNISGKTIYVGNYQGGGKPYDNAIEYPISTKPTKLFVKSISNGDLTNVIAFQLYFDNGTTSGSCILKASVAVGSGITEAAWNVETPEASLELVNGEVYITFLNGYYLTMFKPGAYPFVMQIVTDIESGSTPSVVESGIYDALDKMSETLTDVITKSDTAYYKGISNPRLNYDITSGITFEYLALSGDNITYNSSSIATDASIDANNGVLGVYTTGNTHVVTKNDSVTNDRVIFNSIPSNIKMYWNLSYTGNTSHYIAVNCTVNDGTNGYCRWDWKNDQYVPNNSYINTAVTLTYDSTNQVVTITPSSSSALTSINYVRCNRYIAPSSALTQDDSRIGLVTIDTDSYKLQEALDNKVDTTTYTAYTANTQTVLNSKLDATAYTPVQVSSAITENDTNAVEGGVLYDELRLVTPSSEVELVFENSHATNLPNNCSAIKVTVTENKKWGTVFLDNYAIVQIAYFDELGVQGWETYDISGNTATLYLPSSYELNSVFKGTNGNPDYINVAAITPSVATPLINQVSANTAAISEKVDASDVTTAVTSGSTDVVTSGGVYAKMGGMTIVKITESDYAALVDKDENVLYIVIPDPNP